MHIRLVAVGDRQPTWVDDAFEIYTGRFPPQWKFRLESIPASRRSKGHSAAAAIQAETEQILDKLVAGEQMVLLDERGRQFRSTELAASLQDWQSAGRDLCFVIGGPDGVGPACRERAEVVWSLSNLTLPHGLARVLFAEQLFRAWSLQTGHPYHRE